jgi:hypothetical protein
MLAEQIVQLGDRWMIVGKNLGLELAQGLFHLCRIQFHDLFLDFNLCGCVLNFAAHDSEAMQIHFIPGGRSWIAAKP